MQKTPKVSVVMPAYNAEKYVSEAIESILNQTFKDFEFIIVNDCSTDSTKEIIEKYAQKDNRIKLINNLKNLNVAKTANKGIYIAKGEYIVRLDADDWSYPDRIEKQVQYMDKHPEVVLSSGNMEICDQDMHIKNKTHLPTNYTDIMSVLLQYNPTAHSAMIYRKDAAMKVGGYGDINTCEDYIFVIDMSAMGKLGNLDDVLTKYRVLSTSATSKKAMDMQLSTLFAILKAHLKYGYPLTFKIKCMTIVRLLIAYCVPSAVWRYISTVLRK